LKEKSRNHEPPKTEKLPGRFSGRAGGDMTGEQEKKPIEKLRQYTKTHRQRGQIGKANSWNYVPR